MTGNLPESVLPVASQGQQPECLTDIFPSQGQPRLVLGLDWLS